MATPIVYDGFSALLNGMNGGISPSLIQPTQVSAARDFTFRGAFAHTRPPFSSLILTFDSDTTETRFNGNMQGWTPYAAEVGDPGFVCSISGRLFRIEIGQTQNLVTEITPTLPIVTTADFTVPAPAASVVVFVNSESPINVGDTVKIDSGTYTVTNRATGQITVTYGGGAANAVASAGDSVLDSNSVQITLEQTNPDFFDFIYLFQAENYIIVCAGQQKLIFYDGVSSRQAQIGELPPAILGIYAWGRVWLALPDGRRFMAGDVVYGPSGTAPLAFRDAILKTTENTFLNEGGFFAVPNNAGTITGMQLLATQDTSLGTGQLLVGTTNGVFSVNAPVDRTIWKNLTYPIQTVALIDYGPTGPRNGCSVNGDWWYRSLDGIRSFRVARQEIDEWGNTPMSDEVRPILDFDTEDLLYYGSQVLFDNKLFCTVDPIRTDQGVVHNGLVVINFDEITNLSGKTAPAWEGALSGLQKFGVSKVRIKQRERAFMFVKNSCKIELWELLTEKAGFYDTYNSRTGNERSIVRTSIQPWLETKSMDYGSPFTPKVLNMGELYIDDIVDSITIVVKFKPDQYPAWITWGTIQICANVTQCTVQAPSGFSCSVWKTRQRQYAARVLLPSPSEQCNTIAGIPVNIGHEFQFRLEGTGHFQIRRFRTHAIPQPQDTEGQCPAEIACKTFEGCDTIWFGQYSAHGTAPSPTCT